MPRWNIDIEHMIQDLSEMVAINSINSGLQPDGPNEAQMAEWSVKTFQAMGLEAWSVEAAPGHPNAYGKWQGSGGGKSILLTGHTDVVQITNMTIAPFDPRVAEGRLYGRGSFDMKAGLASCLGAVKALQEGGFQPKGDVYLGFVADEEYSSLGTTRLVKDLKPDAAILTEPSDGQISLAHRGFAWITLKTTGKAAHGSLFDVGIDAIRHMGKLLGELDRLEREVFPQRSHHLLGRPSAHASLIDGGNGLSTYPEAARLVVEHRPLPDEGPEYLMGLWNDAIKRFSAEDATFAAEAHLDIFQNGWEVEKESPIVATLAGAFKDALGEEPEYRGQFGWLDSAIMHAAGIPVVVYGPCGDGAHAAVEYVDLESVQKCAAVIAETVARWSG